MYPWDQWFDGQIWKLTRGKDFKTEIKNFRSSVTQTAIKKGFKVLTRSSLGTGSKEEFLILQYIGKREDMYEKATTKKEK